MSSSNTTRPSRSSRTRRTRGLRTTSQAASDNSSAQPVRSSFTAELEQLKLQVELMALKVDQALDRSIEVLLDGGDGHLAAEVIAGDDEIDAMLVSLTERCYDLLVRQSPVASDLRLVVSVVRILYDLERTGDLCLRIVNLAPDQPLLASNAETFEILGAMSGEARTLFSLAVRAWASQDLRLARTLEERDDAMDTHNVSLMAGIMRISGDAAVPIAISTLLAGRALERIADHSVMIGERLRYMMTGDVDSLSKEIGP